MTNNWENKNLDDVCMRIFAGGDVPKNNLSKTKTGKYNIPIFANGATNKGLYGYTDIEKVTEPSITVSARGTIGYSEIRYEPFYPVVRLIVLVPDTNIISLPFLKYVVSNMNFKNSGTSIPQLTVPMIKKYKALIPPLPEQKRIVSILDEAFTDIDKAKENAEKNLQNARELFESYLQSVFANPGDGWEEKKLGDICGFVRGPFGGSLKKSCFKPSGIAVYEQQHAIYDQFEKIRYFMDEKKFNEMQRFEVRPGDLIMSCSGTMGKVAIVPKSVRKGIINQALLKLSPNKTLLARYLKAWMRSFNFQNQLEKYSLGAAIKNVASVKTLKEINIPLPSVLEQKEIIARIDSLSVETKKLKSIYQQKLADLEELKKSILQKAFEGEL